MQSVAELRVSLVGRQRDNGGHVAKLHFEPESLVITTANASVDFIPVVGDDIEFAGSDPSVGSVS
jgi:hypothetical protein